MATRVFSFFAGLFYVLLGLAGFIPAMRRVPFSNVPIRNTDSAWDVEQLFGCLPVTTAANLLHAVIGAAGVLAAVGMVTARSYTRGLAALMAFLVVAGVMPFGLSSLGGALPLSGGMLALHLITAPMAFYFGYVHLFDAADSQLPGIS